MDDESVTSRRCDSFDKTEKACLRILIINANAAFDRDRNVHRAAHRRHAISDKRRRFHETGAKSARLHAGRGTTNIEVDFVVTKTLANARGLRQNIRLAAAKLQRHRVLARIKTQ